MTDRARIARQMNDPAILRLHRSLSRLSSVVTVMNTGAHPDDEQSGLLAYLRFGLGMRVVIACSTRGEGGQNVLGPERGGRLGALRTREMEEAARVLDADVAWLGFGPEDPVHDFGFSKTGEGTFKRWGEERIVERLVRAYRRYRPDVVLPTFLDVPGQHGHHRAMTQAAARALALAADPAAFPEHAKEGLMPWQVACHYLPAWSGGGGTYDDEVPPPAATLTIRAEGIDMPTGAAWDHIGEWSRWFHATQAMGHWRDHPRQTWALHRVGGPAETRLAQDVPATLTDLAALSDAPASLAGAAQALDAARAAFPDREAILSGLLQAEGLLAKAAQDAPDFPHLHRIRRKQQETRAAIFQAAGVDLRAWAEPAHLPAGARGSLRWTAGEGHDLRLSADVPEGVSVVEAGPGRIDLIAAPDAPYTQPFAEGWSVLGGNGAAGLTAHLRIAGQDIAQPVDLDEPLAIVPAQTLTIEPEAVILRRGSTPRAIPIRVFGAEVEFPPNPDLAFADGAICPDPALPAGLHVLTPRIDGRPAMRCLTSHHAHVGTLTWLEPARLQVLALDLTLPEAHVAYIGGGSDRVADWMRLMGLSVEVLDRLDPDEDFSRFTTVLVGILSFGKRADLIAAMPALHRFVERGGHLVTLYQRPDQGWSEKRSPRPLTIGTPSLRWRVTDPQAEVTVLCPDHPLLTGPNRIGPADWAGWDKERGLYFASAWDAAYEPLLSMSDAPEAPLQGALLSARIGKGRHSHVALVLHHQLDRMVPGAFRLLANLVQPADR